jgi:hypothetical protein
MKYWEIPRFALGLFDLAFVLVRFDHVAAILDNGQRIGPIQECK